MSSRDVSTTLWKLQCCYTAGVLRPFAGSAEPSVSGTLPPACQPAAPALQPPLCCSCADGLRCSEGGQAHTWLFTSAAPAPWNPLLQDTCLAQPFTLHLLIEDCSERPKQKCNFFQLLSLHCVFVFSSFTFVFHFLFVGITLRNASAKMARVFIFFPRVSLLSRIVHSTCLINICRFNWLSNHWFSQKVSGKVPFSQISCWTEWALGTIL